MKNKMIYAKTPATNFANQEYRRLDLRSVKRTVRPARNDLQSQFNIQKEIASGNSTKFKKTDVDFNTILGVKRDYEIKIDILLKSIYSALRKHLSVSGALRYFKRYVLAEHKRYQKEKMSIVRDFKPLHKERRETEADLTVINRKIDGLEKEIKTWEFREDYGNEDDIENLTEEQREQVEVFGSQVSIPDIIAGNKRKEQSSEMSSGDYLANYILPNIAEKKVVLSATLDALAKNKRRKRYAKMAVAIHTYDEAVRIFRSIPQIKTFSNLLLLQSSLENFKTSDAIQEHFAAIEENGDIVYKNYKNNNNNLTPPPFAALNSSWLATGTFDFKINACYFTTKPTNGKVYSFMVYGISPNVWDLIRTADGAGTALWDTAWVDKRTNSWKGPTRKNKFEGFSRNAEGLPFQTWTPDENGRGVRNTRATPMIRRR